MRDILPEILKWYRQERTIALATVVATWHSAPRPAGASMAVGPDGSVVGSVSGGCVEGAVYELGQEAISSGVPVLQRYGVSDDDAFAVGLTCGGVLDVFVTPLNRATFGALEEVAASVEAHEPVAVATVVSGPGEIGTRVAVWPDHVSGSFGLARLDDHVVDDVRGLLDVGVTRMLHYGADGERLGDELGIFVESFAPAPRMIVFGAIDFARAVVRIGKFLGYRVTVCDARSVFATTIRFPEADEVIVDWPHRYLSGTSVDARTVLCVLTHDPKFDVPLLEVALRTECGYIGAMGSRRTQAERAVQLRERGVTDDEMARLRSPIGLDIGGHTPEETAVSIAAEIITERRGGSGRALSSLDAPIHSAAAFLT